MEKHVKIKKYNERARPIGWLKRNANGSLIHVRLLPISAFEYIYINRKLSMSAARQESQLVLKIYRIFHHQKTI